MINYKCHTIRKIPKSNSKIAETDAKYIPLIEIESFIENKFLLDDMMMMSVLQQNNTLSWSNSANTPK
jgi:hypothetical protein